MYLVRLEMLGYKSFADKTILQLGPGVTVVIGPNGSGKSNIADALVWVTGEQNARYLRGERMEDLIFSGSGCRKPLGLAEVSVTLDNSDNYLSSQFSEVLITRRLFRSGESQYLINRQACRLRDVESLLVGTGLGRQGMAIVRQGQVEEFFALRPEQRRPLIEDLAGIGQHRLRKKEAEHQLTGVDHNLGRLVDLTGELQRQLEPLVEQVAKAERYQHLKAELRLWQVCRICHRLEACLKEQTMSMSRFSSTIQEVEALELRRRYLVELLRRLEQREQGAKEVLEHRCNKFKDNQDKLRSLNSEASLLEERLANLRLRIKELAGRETREKELAKTARNRHQQLERDLEEGQRNFRCLVKEVERLTEKRAVLASANESLQEQLAAGRTELISVLQQEAGLSSQFKTEADFVFLQQQYQKILARQAELTHGRQEMEGRLANLDNHKQGLLTRLALRRQEHESLATLARKQQGELEACRQLCHRLREREQGLRARLAVLEELKTSGEGYGLGTRSVLVGRAERHPACRQVLGVVAELIKVPVEYRQAVESALGQGLQYVIVETDAGGREAIDFLKATRGGRATFLPLNALKPRKKVLDLQSWDKSKGVIGLASDLVEVDDHCRPAIEYLLGQTWLVTDTRAALDLARRTSYRVRMVTLEGDIIQPGGLITGGSFSSRMGGLLARETERGRLRQELADLEDELLRIELQFASQETSLSQLQQECVNLAEGVHREEQSTIDNKEESHRTLALLASIRKEQEGLQSEIQQIRELLQNGSAMEQEYAEKRRELLQRKAMLTTRNALLEQEEKNLRAEDQALSEHWAESRRRLAVVELGITTNTGELNRLGSEDKVYSEEASSIAGERQKLDFSALDLEVKLERARLNMEILKGERQELAGEKDLAEKRYKVISAARTKTAAKLAELTVSLSSAEVKKRSQELEDWELKRNWEVGLENLRASFDLDYEQAALLVAGLPEEKAPDTRIQDLSRELDALGPINMGVQEQYRQLQERYDYYCRQKKDLVAARQSLREALTEIERIMTQRFLAAFQTLDEAFGRIFQELFDGGSASLRMTGSENLWECGVDIMVCPPGKRQQFLGLLSGGEKALTTVAFFFATLAVRPVPFCLLDEVEASLDEANVSRVASYIRKLSGKTQFLVITHRQATMEIADTLYGVSMEEQGVSKLLSLRLSNSMPLVG